MKRDANFVCLPAKIKDGHVEQVRAILGSYEYEGMVADVKEQESGWFLDFSEESEETAELWAVRAEVVPGEADYPDEDAYWTARYDLFTDKGDEGFDALLREVCPHLDTILLIVFLGHGYSATAILIQPENSDVTYLSLDL